MSFDIQEFIQEAIFTFQSKRRLMNMWRAPLAAVLPADHALIPTLREMAAGDHLLPEELLPGAKSIIVFFVPFDNRIIESNIKGEAASKEWAGAYVTTNELLAFISDAIEQALTQKGFRTGKIQATHNFDERTLLSRWSHRHIAWIGGLGTFGINNMLITSMGCCGRLSSLVTDAGIGEFAVATSTAISAAGSIPEKCLYKIDGSCGLCLKKCPSGAYDPEGFFDRHKCYELCLKNAELHKALGLADVCGKCLVGLPCSSRDPSLRV